MKHINPKRLIYLCFLFLMSLNFSLKSHSVQIAYCVDCSGNLRIFVEHWHGTEDPNSTTMTINYTTGGVTTSIVGSPAGSIQNVPFGQLPGCATPATSFGSVSGEANTYNDWVYYDFLNPPTGVPITITVLSGSTVFTEDGGGMYPATITFTIPPISNVAENVPAQVTCHTTNFGATTFTSASVTNWTNSNPSIGLAATGTGNIPAFTSVNNTNADIVSTITFTNGCKH